MCPFLMGWIKLPDGAAPHPDGVKMELRLQRAGEAAVQERFILEAIPAALEGNALNRMAKPGYTLYAYRIAPADIARLEGFRADAQAKKAENASKPKTNFTLNIGVDACRKGELPAGKLLATTYLQLDRESGYLPLLVDYDLRQTVDGKELAAMIPPC